jgi:hypothetical protein
VKRFSHVCFLLASLHVLAAFYRDNAIVPKDEILSGGPPKDGIPAILKPRFISADKAAFLNPDDEVIGVRAGGQVKAYPIKILNWHEVVNDTIGAIPIVVTF